MIRLRSRLGGCPRVMVCEVWGGGPVRGGREEDRRWRVRGWRIDVTRAVPKYAVLSTEYGMPLRLSLLRRTTGHGSGCEFFETEYRRLRPVGGTSVTPSPVPTFRVD